MKLHNLGISQNNMDRLFFVMILGAAILTMFDIIETPMVLYTIGTLGSVRGLVRMDIIEREAEYFIADFTQDTTTTIIEAIIIIMDTMDTLDTVIQAMVGTDNICRVIYQHS
jgi:hypothetical protein